MLQLEARAWRRRDWGRLGCRHTHRDDNCDGRRKNQRREKLKNRIERDDPWPIQCSIAGHGNSEGDENGPFNAISVSVTSALFAINVPAYACLPRCIRAFARRGFPVSSVSDRFSHKRQESTLYFADFGGNPSAVYVT
jgi:hypothetical protein